MGDWTRVDPDAPEDAPPGHWRNYLAKYSEAQALYERMLQVSDEVQAAQAAPGATASVAAAAADLGRGQCNCAYWHGVFGGLYLNNLRHALNSHLLLAEQALPYGVPTAEAPGLRLRSGGLSLQFSPGHGLALDRLDGYDPPFVWTNVLTRRREHYHRKLGKNYIPADHASIHDRVLVKEEGLEDRLVYDAHPRCSFNCSLAPAVASPQQFMSLAAAAMAQWERAADDYSAEAQDLQRSAEGVAGEVQLGPCRLRKSARLDGSTLHLAVELVEGAVPDQHLLWVEFNFNVLTDQADDRYLLLDGARVGLSAGEQRAGLRSFTLCDGWQQRQLRLESETPAAFISYPIYAVSSSEGGFERTYQGSCFMLGYAALAPGGGIALTLRIEELGHAAAG
jgi:alpha-amylase